MAAADVIAARQAEQASLIELARGFVLGLPSGLGVSAAVVVGSVARGDFNAASDVDLLVVASNLADSPLRRAEEIGAAPPRVEVVAWSPADWELALRTGNPLAVEAMKLGVWLMGSQTAIEAATAVGGATRP